MRSEKAHKSVDPKTDPKAQANALSQSLTQWLESEKQAFRRQ